MYIVCLLSLSLFTTIGKGIFRRHKGISLSLCFLIVRRLKILVSIIQSMRLFRKKQKKSISNRLIYGKHGHTNHGCCGLDMVVAMMFIVFSYSYRGNEAILKKGHYIYILDTKASGRIHEKSK